MTTNPDGLVIDALKTYETFRASDGYMATRMLVADDLIQRLGIPGDMTVADLRSAVAAQRFWRGGTKQAHPENTAEQEEA
jgi:hypothetical protein